jgi:hypothetical protein
VVAFTGEEIKKLLANVRSGGERHNFTKNDPRLGGRRHHKGSFLNC